MRFEDFMHRMRSYERAVRMQREADIEATKAHMKNMGYTEAEIARLNFTRPASEDE